MDFAESTIKTYSGLSSEIKPTIAGGTDVPNGSRWREVGSDGIYTGKIYYFNLSDDNWYEYTQSVLTTDELHFDTSSLLNRILRELKKINLQLSLVTDEEIKNVEIE